jgi:hypothetical protein
MNPEDALQMAKNAAERSEAMGWDAAHAQRESSIMWSLISIAESLNRAAGAAILSQWMASGVTDEEPSGLTGVRADGCADDRLPDTELDSGAAAAQLGRWLANAKHTKDGIENNENSVCCNNLACIIYFCMFIGYTSTTSYGNFTTHN